MTALRVRLRSVPLPPAALCGLAVLATSLLAVATVSLGPLLLLALVVGAVLLGILIRPFLGVGLFVFLVPLQYLTLLPNQSTLVKYAGWAMFVSWALSKLGRRESIGSMLRQHLGSGMMFFLSIVFISALWSPLSGWLSSLFTYLQLVLMVILLRDQVSSEQRLVALILLLIAGTVVSAGIALLEYAGSFALWEFRGRTLGGFGDGNYTSASLMFVVPYLLLYLSSHRPWVRLVAFVSLLLIVAAVGTTVSRAGLLALPLALGLHLSRAKQRADWFSIGAAVAILLLVAFLVWPQESIEARFAAAWSGGAGSDLGGRVALFRVGIERFLARPLTGYGLGTDDPSAWRFVAHNLFLAVASKLGLPGLIAMVWMIYAAWRAVSRGRRVAEESRSQNLVGLLGAISDSLLIYLFFSLSLSTETSRLLWLGLALAGIGWSLARSSSTDASPPSSRDRSTLKAHTRGSILRFHGRTPGNVTSSREGLSV